MLRTSFERFELAFEWLHVAKISFEWLEFAFEWLEFLSNVAFE